VRQRMQIPMPGRSGWYSQAATRQLPEGSVPRCQAEALERSPQLRLHLAKSASLRPPANDVQLAVGILDESDDEHVTLSHRGDLDEQFQCFRAADWRQVLRLQDAVLHEAQDAVLRGHP